ncbi:MAG TPA: protein-L-isoaspartate O-methyltransferase [Devosia sp.]|jgi:protein-L-isoaspartate(D-aspartate) O-methyltransferase|nr:protein-L-isoaspartate O-methyltransferase [Devosia sp.]
MRRRSFLLSLGAAAVAGALPSLARADVPIPYDWTATPPVDTRQNFIDWMVKTRGEDPKFLGERYDRYQWMLSVRDVFGDNNKRAMLMVPREEFCLPVNRPHAYDIDFLDIGFGVTISGPGLVARMTSTLGIAKGDKVLEIGTGSGYQSAVLANLTDQVWTIEIIKPLADRTRGVYDGLIGRGYTEYKAITTRQADGYYGWPEAGPFDKIIVTCGIDHIPPPLLEQLQPNGIMVVPIGPPGAQHVLKVIKAVAADGTVSVKRSDIYNGRIVPFVPFTALQGDIIKGTHNG